MLDFKFDMVNREIVLGPDGDFVLTTNPSVQNGGSLAYSSGASVAHPEAGVDIERLLNGGAGTPAPALELNRWQTQTEADGATIALWESNPLQAGPFKFKLKVSYL